MKERRISQRYVSQPTRDGAGVSLRRLFWRADTLDIDPFLMLDLFDQTDPEEYLKGFPMHPHRGIETLTYLIAGEIDHKDTLGNTGTISSGHCQWMSAGSGILHEEMPQRVDHMLGFQLWINLPQPLKMSEPTYLALTEEDIPVYEDEISQVKVIAGQYLDTVQTKGKARHPVNVWDISLAEGQSLSLPIAEEDNCMIVSMLGEGEVAGAVLQEKEAFVMADGDTVTVTATGGPLRFFVFSGVRLGEPIAWGGPIVMNTQEELRTAQQELREGTFIKTKGVDQ